jgi:hypothetical protein
VYEEAPGFRLAPRVNSQKQQRCLIVIPSTCPYQVLAHCVEVGHAEAAVHDEVFVRREDVLAGVLLGACRAVLEGEPAAYGGGGGARGTTGESAEAMCGEHVRRERRFGAYKQAPGFRPGLRVCV